MFKEVKLKYRENNSCLRKRLFCNYLKSQNENERTYRGKVE